jgi:mRNA interferase MazF
VRNQATVAVVTTRIRNNQVEVRVGPEDGLPRISVVNLDSLRTIPLQLLQERITVLSHAKMRAVEAALRFGLGMRTEA